MTLFEKYPVTAEMCSAQVAQKLMDSFARESYKVPDHLV